MACQVYRLTSNAFVVRDFGLPDGHPEGGVYGRDGTLKTFRSIERAKEAANLVNERGAKLLQLGRFPGKEGHEVAVHLEVTATRRRKVLVEVGGLKLEFRVARDMGSLGELGALLTRLSKIYEAGR